MYEGQSGAPWWIRVDAVTVERYLVAIQSGYVNTALPSIVIGPRLAGYGGASCALACTAHMSVTQQSAVASLHSSFTIWSTLSCTAIYYTCSCWPNCCHEMLVKQRAQLVVRLMQDVIGLRACKGPAVAT